MQTIDRRGVLGLAASALAIGSGIRSSSAASEGIETIDVTPALISAAQREGKVVVRYSSPVDEMAQMSEAFYKRFNITVQADRKVGVLGTQQFATEERAGRHIMDVNYSADPTGIKDLAEEGYYLRFTLPDLEAKLDKAAYLPTLGYCPKWTEVVISYNPSAIPHERARELFKTWNGLLDPALKGKIGLNEPAGGGVPFATYLMFYRNPQYGKEFLAKLAAQRPRLYPGSAQAREDLGAGAISVFIPNWESIAMIGVLRGDKTAWTYPDIAPAFANTYFCISKNAPNPNAARLFAAWFFTPEGAAVMQLAQAKPTLKNQPEMRTAVAELKKTDWWRPYPEEIRWIPDTDDWIKSSDTLIPEMRRTLGWRG
ncbi:extracellular solute-binding protein [Bradyrhizobium sp. LHD-71]|uniref:ABC transporter substrate-binding protein n=1 Tax=Bradyrhizobium sp. LHD-71 TaxID=3072141 RepID=UPI00280C43CC|nr:extracellular solute-binding protein [Bradyrhizobium sp. LHD-71]MDQ8731459.1 extracellular solute-binding protein [Bradyrhizobium sp. LHD-71]